MSVISGLSGAKSGSVFDRLNDPSTFTGVYAERFRAGPGINSDGDAGGSNVRDLSSITRDHLNRDTSPKLRAAEKNRARLEAAERAAASGGGAPGSQASSLYRGHSNSGGSSFHYPDNDDGGGSGYSGDAAQMGATNSGDSDASPLDTNTQLQLLYSFYCRFGRTAGSGDEAVDIDNVNFSKLARECPGLLNSVLTPTEVDLIFVKCKAKTARRLTYGQFLDALSAMATVRYHDVASSDPVAAFSLLLENHIFKCPASIGIAAAVRSGMLQLGPASSSSSAGVGEVAMSSGGPTGPLSGAALSRRRNSISNMNVDPATMDAVAAASLATQQHQQQMQMQQQQQARASPRSNTTQHHQQQPQQPRPATAPSFSSSSSGPSSSGISLEGYTPVIALMPSPGAPGDASAGIPAGYLPVQVMLPPPGAGGSSGPTGGYPVVTSVATSGYHHGDSDISAEPQSQQHQSQQTRGRARGDSASGSVLSYSYGAAAPGTYPHPAGSAYQQSISQQSPSRSNIHYRAGSARASRSPSRGSILGGGPGGDRGSVIGGAIGNSSGSVLGSGLVSNMGSPAFKPTMAGEANRPGGVYDRLASPTSFTGIYRRAWLTDGRINHFADTGVSRIPSKFEGSTNTGSNETIHDLKHLLRPNLGVGKGFRP